MVWLKRAYATKWVITESDFKEFATVKKTHPQKKEAMKNEKKLKP